MKFSLIQADAFGLVALAGASTNNVRHRHNLQKDIDAGTYDEVLSYLGVTRESFIESIDRLAEILASEYQRN